MFPRIKNYRALLPEILQDTCQLLRLQTFGQQDQQGAEVEKMEEDISKVIGIFIMGETIGALSEEEYKVYEASMKIPADEMDMEEHGYERGRKEGIEEDKKVGIEEGMKEGMISTIKMLVEGGMPISEIARLLHLSEEEIHIMLA